MIFSKFMPLFLLFSALAAAEPVGRIAAVEGDVRIDGKSVEIGTPVVIGAVVETGNGKCTLLLGKTSVIHLDSDSKLKVTQHLVQSNGEEASSVDLHHGRTRALVRNTGGKRIFRIRTRAAVMGVRGTHIYVDSPKNRNLAPQFVTLEGAADLEMASRPGVQIQKLTLATNQAFTASEIKGAAAPPLTNLVREITPDNAKALAAQVAPPPPEVRRPEDSGKPSDKPKKKPKPPKGPGAGTRPSIPGGQVPQDPVKDVPKFAVTVNITGKRAAP